MGAEQSGAIELENYQRERRPPVLLLHSLRLPAHPYTLVPEAPVDPCVRGEEPMSPLEQRRCFAFDCYLYCGHFVFVCPSQPKEQARQQE